MVCLQGRRHSLQVLQMIRWEKIDVHGKSYVIGILGKKYS